MLTSRMTRSALALLAATLALASCGSQDPKPAAVKDSATATATAATATPTPAVTHAQFARTVNASCKRGDARSDALEKRFESAMERNELREAGRIYDRMHTLLVQHVNRVAKLEVPAVDRDAMRRYMNAERRIIGYGERMGASLLDNDLSGVTLLVPDLQREQKRRITAAIDIGASKCGG